MLWDLSHTLQNDQPRFPSFPTRVIFSYGVESSRIRGPIGACATGLRGAHSGIHVDTPLARTGGDIKFISKNSLVR